ncbi:nucleoside deaminase [Streptomyces sp. URMC 123]|uniref:nucleoside deaminase n=1 Tax=Streptomyces sp. URMC 123 TaxID=3423403 RepID=UPI003F1B06C6
MSDPLRDPWLAPMRQALDEAVRAPGTGDVPVGAVVLDPSGVVIGRGHNEREATGDPTAHAEVLAIRQAARTLAAAGAAEGPGEAYGRPGAPRPRDWRLIDCTLVVTLEPCTMCAGAIVLSRLDRVVYGAVDEKAGAAGSLWDVIRDRRLNHRPEVVSGVLAEECSALLTRFFRESDFGARPTVR